MGLLDSTLTQTNTRFPPSLFNLETTGGSALRTAMTGPDTFKAGLFLPQDIQGLRAENLSGIRDLLASIRGNQGSILEARLGPLQRQLAGRPEAVDRDFARRGISGTFRNDAVSNESRRVGEALGEAKSLALNDLISTETGLLDRISGAADSVLGQELASVGLSMDAVKTIIDSMRTSSTTEKENDPGGSLEGIANILEILFP